MKKKVIKKKIENLILIIVIGVLLFNLNCSMSVTDTSGSETGNAKIAGIIIDTSGNYVEGAIVKLIPREYNPIKDSLLSSKSIDTTDSNGIYSFDFIENGSYNILASNNNCTFSLRIGTDVDNNTISDLVDTLKESGTIKVIVSTNIIIDNKSFVYIEGTDIYKKVDSTVVFLDFVPAGSIPKIVFISDTEESTLVDSMTVIPNDTVIQASVLLITKFSVSEVDTISLFMAEKLMEIGLTVTMVDDSTVSLADTAGMSAVIFSSTAYERPRLGTIFKDMPLPLLNMEFSLLKHIGMTDTVQGMDYGKLPGIECDIYDPSHSIAGGLSGVVTMYSDSSGIEWGKPGTGAQKIAVLPGTIDSAAIFCYENDAEMVGMKAPAKRGAFLLHGEEVYKLTNDGWYLFRNMVKWLFE